MALHGTIGVEPANTKSAVARALISVLSSECESYCILSGYEKLPDWFDTDIDFMVGVRDFARLPGLIQKVAGLTGMRVFHAVDHELTGRAYFLAAASDGGRLELAQLDAASDYRHFGKLWLRCGEVLSARRKDVRGFFVPSPAHEFAYYLIKRVNKRDFRPAHGLRLQRLYAEDPAGCNALLVRFWSGYRAQALRQMAAGGDWGLLIDAIDAFRMEMRRRSAESWLEQAVSWPRRVSHFVSRIVRPTGGWIAFMGPDGCGKSTVIERVSQAFAPAFRQVVRYHMRPKLLGSSSGPQAAVTDPHGQPPRSLAASIAKIFYFGADYIVGYLLRIVPAVIRTRLVVFDRYIYDLLVDSRRVRYGGPAWLLRLLAFCVPRPDLVVLLDASPEVLWARKQEVTFEEVVRQRGAFVQVVGGLRAAVTVNAAQPLEVVTRDVYRAVIDCFARRTAARLSLPCSSAQSSANAVQGNPA